mgnify:CR=1 FL=1
MKRILAATAAVCLCLCACLCGCGDDGTGMGFRFPLGAEPTGLDPQTATDTAAVTVIASIFEGLTRLDAAGNPVDAAATHTLSEDGKTYTPEMVLGPARKGIKVTYCTDTRPLDSIAENAFRADLFICEGMYGEDDKLDNAKENKHMTMMEAASLAGMAEVGEMWLTHYSPATARPQEFEDKIKAIFPRTIMSKDRRTIELKFED